MLSTNKLYRGPKGPVQVISFSADEDELLALVGILILHPIGQDDLGKTEGHIIDKLLDTLNVALDQIQNAE